MTPPVAKPIKVYYYRQTRAGLMLSVSEEIWPSYCRRLTVHPQISWRRLQAKPNYTRSTFRRSSRAGRSTTFGGKLHGKSDVCWIRTSSVPRWIGDAFSSTTTTQSTSLNRRLQALPVRLRRPTSSSRRRSPTEQTANRRTRSAPSERPGRRVR